MAYTGPTALAKAIDNIATTVAVAYTPPVSPIAYPAALAIASGTGIGTLSTTNWVRVSTARSGSPLSILKATALTSGTNNGVAAVTVTGGGSGGTNNTYTDGTFTGGGGSGATFSYTISGGAVQNTITVNNPGSGYTSAPTAVFGSHGQSGVTTTVTISPWVLTISGTADSYTDQSLVIGDAAELRVTAGAFNDIKTAVNNLETNANLPVLLASGTAIPTASGQLTRAGVAPDPGASSGTTKFLREDATWVVPSGSGLSIGGAVSGGTNNSVLYVNGSGNLADSGPIWDGNSLTVSSASTTTSTLVVKNTQTSTGAVALEVHSPDENPYMALFYNDAYSTSASIHRYFGWNTGQFGMGGTGDLYLFTEYGTRVAFAIQGHMGGVDNPRYVAVNPLGTSGTTSGTAFSFPATFYVNAVDDLVPTVQVRAVGSQTQDLQQWANSTPTVLTRVRADGSIALPSIANASAVNSSLFWDTTASKLTYKDSTGTLHAV